MNIKGFFAGAAMLVALPGLAAAAVIDFDDLDSTDLQPVPLTTFTEDGFTFQVTYTGPSDGAAVFDTTCTGYTSNCNGDTDLVPATQGENGVSGNVLILQENNINAPTPNDEAKAGSITLTLISGSAFVFEGASVVDDQPITFSSAIDGVLGTVDAGGNRDTAAITFAMPSSVINIGDSITISYAGSGGIDSLVLAAVPLPASIALLLAGLGGLGAMRRRSKAAA